MIESAVRARLRQCALFEQRRRRRADRHRATAPAAASSGGTRSSSTRATPGDTLQVVHAASVKIVLPSAEGEEAIIATLRPGRLLRRAGPCSTGRHGPHGGRARGIGDLAAAAGRPSGSCWTTIRACGTRCSRASPTSCGASPGQVEELHFLDLAGRLAMRLEPAGSGRGPDIGRGPLDWPSHPVGPRLDDRRHPPERQQAAQRAGR